MARDKSTESWQVKALVEATPISGPARVGKMASLSRGDGAFRHIDNGGNMLSLFAAIAQGGERVGSFPGLGDEKGKSAFFHGHFSITEFGRNINIDGDAGQCLEPVFCNNTSIIGGATSCHGDAAQIGKIEWQGILDAHCATCKIDVMGQCVLDHFRLFMDFLLHEMLVIALFNHIGGKLPPG